MKYLWLLLIPVVALADNWAALMFQSVSGTDDLRQRGSPTNTVAMWQNIGTNTSVRAPYVFVGNDAAKADFIAAREVERATWRTNTYDVVVSNANFLSKSNDTFLVNEYSNLTTTVSRQTNFTATTAPLQLSNLYRWLNHPKRTNQ